MSVLVSSIFLATLTSNSINCVSDNAYSVIELQNYWQNERSGYGYQQQLQPYQSYQQDIKHFATQYQWPWATWSVFKNIKEFLAEFFHGGTARQDVNGLGLVGLNFALMLTTLLANIGAFLGLNQFNMQISDQGKAINNLEDLIGSIETDGNTQIITSVDDSSLQELNNRLDDISVEVTMTSSRLDEMDLQSIETEIAQLSKEQSDLDFDVAFQGEELAVVRKRISPLEVEIVDVVTQVNNINNILNQHDDVLTGLQTSMEMQDEVNNNVETRLLQVEGSVGELSDYLVQLENSLGLLENRVETSETSFTELSEKDTDLQMEITQLNTELAEDSEQLQTQVQELSDQGKDDRNLLNFLDARLVEIERRFETLAFAVGIEIS